MREVVIQSWCDECAANGEDIQGEPIDIEWKGREYSLDLCDDHAQPFREVERLIAAYGYVAKKPSPKPKKHNNTAGTEYPSFKTEDGIYQCPDCARTSVTPQGLSAHRRNAHNYRPNG